MENKKQGNRKIRKTGRQENNGNRRTKGKGKQKKLGKRKKKDQGGKVRTKGNKGEQDKQGLKRVTTVTRGNKANKG